MKYAQMAEIVDELRQEAALEYGKGAGRSRQVKLNFGLVSSARRYSGPVAGMIGQRISQSIYMLAEFIMDGIPLSHADSKAYKRTQRKAFGRAPLVSTQTLSNIALPILYEAIENDMGKSLARAPAFAVSFDAWTDQSMRNSYISLSYHWLDNCLGYQCATLDCLQVNERHTGACLALRIAQRIDYRTSDSQLLVATTTDNAANMRRAGALLLGHFDEFVRQVHRPMLTEDVEDDSLGQDDLSEDVEMRVNSCVCHTIALGVDDALRAHNAGGLADLLSDIDMLVTTIRSSQRRQEQFRDIQRIMRPNEPLLELIPCNATRWHSRCAMLERYLKLQGAIFVFGVETRLFDNLDLRVLRNTIQLSSDQLEMLYGVVEVLKVVRVISRFFESEQASRAAHVPAFGQCLISELRRIANQISGEASAFALVLLEKMELRFQRYMHERAPTMIAARLHPLYAIHFHLQDRQKGVAETPYIDVLNEWHEALDSEAHDVGTQSDLPSLYRDFDISSPDGSEGGGSYQDTRQMYLWLINYKRPYNMTQVGYSFLRSAVEGLSNPDDRAALIPDNNHLPLLREMIKRRPMALVSAISAIDEAALLDQAFDPVHQKLFRTLAAVVHCVPASSAGDERTFSFAGRINTRLRMRLAPERFEQMMAIGLQLRRMTSKQQDEMLDRVAADVASGVYAKHASES